MGTPNDSRTGPAADDRRLLRTPQQPSSLPEWMLNPPPPRRTVGDRLAGAALALPGAAVLRRQWWAWQGRRRLHERYPNAVKVAAFFLCFAAALALVLAANALFGMV
ncbi:hypothetical protein AB0873_01530 [Micromonospora sp. NPDC047707]|uniref:hypothetical protein n=1 Tax=Micromonospora sp. NPDC047707 TaxID=3154498 RepID=UPI00345208EB